MDSSVPLWVEIPSPCLKAAYEAAGLTEDATAANIKLRRLNEKYREFSKAAGLPEQRERLKTYTPLDKAPTPSLEPIQQSYFHDEKDNDPNWGVEEEAPIPAKTVHTIAHIDMEKFKVVSDNIRTDEVIITDERIAHIKESHPGDYEKYSKYIQTMLEKPQYILEDRDKDTAVILQEFLEDGEKFRLILKLATVESDPGKLNSVITFLKISDKKFQKYLRNKKVLYKSE